MSCVYMSTVSAGSHDGTREPPDLKVYVCSKRLSWCAITIFSFFLISRATCSDRFCNMHVNVLLYIVHILLILHVTYWYAFLKCYFEKLNCHIKTHSSESRGQEEAASAHPSRAHGHYNE